MTLLSSDGKKIRLGADIISGQVVNKTCLIENRAYFAIVSIYFSRRERESSNYGDIFFYLSVGVDICFKS
jgi:hypothetical protein